MMLVVAQYLLKSQNDPDSGKKIRSSEGVKNYFSRISEDCHKASFSLCRSSFLIAHICVVGHMSLACVARILENF